MFKRRRIEFLARTFSSSAALSSDSTLTRPRKRAHFVLSFARVMSESLTAWPNAASSVIAFRRHPAAARSVLTEFQNRRLRKIVEHAYNRVSYYRRLFDSVGLR